MKRFLTSFVTLIVALCVSIGTAYPDETELEYEDEMEELFEFMQISTASRREQLLTESPVAIDVITKEEITTSGATEIWDLLRFRVGMDVLDARAGDGNRGIVSVRGFPREYVNNLQVLVDGRSVFSGYSGGVYWPQLPVQIQDIERIEIVRGPSAALYGTNAGLGVIQIFTRKPEHHRVSVRAYAGDPSSRLGAIAIEDIAEDENSGWSLSYTRRDDDVMVTSQGDSGEDNITSDKANARAFVWLDNDNLLEVYTGGAWQTNTVPRGNSGHFRNFFAMTKLSRAISYSSSTEFKASYTESRHRVEQITSTLNWGQLGYKQWDLGGLYQKTWLKNRLQSTWGSDYVRMEAGSDTVFEAKPEQVNEIWRLFSHQTYHYNPWLSLIAALSFEHSDAGGTQYAYQLTGLGNIDKVHTFRFIHSYSPTMPSIYRQEVNHQPSSFGRIVGNPGLEPEELSSYEIGYLGQFLQGKLLVESSLFFMMVKNVNASVRFTNPDAPPPFLVTFNNANEATAIGAEASVRYRYSKGRSIYANYTYEELDDDLGDIMVVKATPRHKFNLGGIVKRGSYTLSMNLGYKDSYTTITANRSSAFIRNIPGQYRLDIRLAYQIDSHWQVALAAQNLTDSNHIEFSDYDDLESSRKYYISVSGDL